jgi:glycosyltransferase involved in cell wall biosynthesis
VDRGGGVKIEVDVILPTHARPQTVGCAIAAVLGQTHTALTLHVVGDGCDDATAEVVASVRDARVRFHRLPKAHGFGYANRNRVLAQTHAPYVAYAADDDLWFPDHLERALQVIERGRLDLVASRSIHVHPPDRLDTHFFAFDWHGPLGGQLRNWFMGAGALVHRRTLFDRIGPWNERVFRFGDRELYNRARRGAPTAYTGEVTVLRFYAQHWDPWYGRLTEPPQRRYLGCVADPSWRAAVRAAVAAPPPLAARIHQWRDFGRFAVRSGPKFARFWYERWASHGSDEHRGDRTP